MFAAWQLDAFDNDAWNVAQAHNAGAQECVCEREIDHFEKGFQQASSLEYSGAAAEILGMLMLLVIMQLCETDQQHTNTHSSTSETTHWPEKIINFNINTI